MLIERFQPGANQFDPANTAFGSGGGVVLQVPAGSGEDFQYRILTGGYSSTGAAHDFEIFLSPPGAIVAGGPRIDLLSATAANSGTICPTWVPREALSWLVRIETTGKTGDGTFSLNLAYLGVLS